MTLSIQTVFITLFIIIVLPVYQNQWDCICSYRQNHFTVLIYNCWTSVSLPDTNLLIKDYILWGIWDAKEVLVPCTASKQTSVDLQHTSKFKLVNLKRLPC